LKYSYFDDRVGLYELCSDDARFFNHADDPNTASVESPAGGHFDVATRDIATGEELTCDYRTFDRDWRAKLRVGSEERREP
jgi:SET domain-containing protein